MGETSTSNMKYTATLLLIAASIALASGQFECPARDGQFMDENQCDKYYICVDGEAEELLCEDGLVFDPFKRTDYKCDLPSLVDCSGREALQRPQPIGDCPRSSTPASMEPFHVCSRALKIRPSTPSPESASITKTSRSVAASTSKRTSSRVDPSATNKSINS